MPNEPSVAEKTRKSHTAGPWTLGTVRTSIGVCHKIGPFPTTGGARSETYACVYEDGTSNWRLHAIGALDSELLANARLIAAAPDLLAALKRVLAIASANCEDTEAELIDPDCHAARAAIAKAEGR